MMQKPFPDFVIIGAMKSGTTSVASVLADLDAISFSIPKEPSMLMRHDYEAMNKSLYVPAATDFDAYYANCFRYAVPDSLWGEGSVAYLADPDSPRIVTARNPDVKVIAMLRDPIKRSTSAFWYTRSVFRETASTFDAAIAEELSGERDNYWPTLRHLDYSNYPKHLSRWREWVQPENLLLLEFESYIRNPMAGISAVCKFLGVAPPDSLSGKEHSNSTVILDNRVKRAVMQTLHTSNPLKTLAKKILPAPTRARLKVGIQDRVSGTSKPIPPSDASMQIMNERFAGMKSVLLTDFNFDAQHWTSGG